jgi:hypothetical protein
VKITPALDCSRIRGGFIMMDTGPLIEGVLQRGSEGMSAERMVALYSHALS